MTIDVDSLPAAAMCTVCKAIKPLAEFKAKATKAQSKAWGFAGNVTLEYDASRCKTCQPKKKTIDKLRRDELLAKVKSGELSQYIVDREIEKREASRANKGRDAITKRWGQIYRESWDAMLEPLGKEIAAVKDQLRKHGQRAPYNQCPNTKDHLEYYLEMLESIRAHSKLERLKEQRRAPSSRWQDYVEANERFGVGERWRAISTEMQWKLRVPKLWD